MFVTTRGINWPLGALYSDPCTIPTYSVVLFWGNIDPINIYRGQDLFKNVVKVFFGVPDYKKVRLLSFSPFHVFSMLWLIGHCVVRASSSSVEQKITNSCRKDIDLFLSVQKSRRYYKCDCKVYIQSQFLPTLFLVLLMHFPKDYTVQVNFLLKCTNHCSICKKAKMLQHSLPASLKHKLLYRM